MARVQSEALVLRVLEFGESDRIVHLLTPDLGRLTAMAKGARRSVRRFPGTLDLFNHLRVHLEHRRGARMDRLEQAALVTPFTGLRASAGRYALASYLVELLDRLAPEGGPEADLARLFAFAAESLGALERQRPDRRLRVLLELRALDALGLRPELERCVRCGRDVADTSGAAVGFHVAEGGPVCGACALRAGGEALLPVHLGTLRTLARGLRLAPGRLDRLSLGRAALDEAERLLLRFQRFHLGLELRSEPFLDVLLADPPAAPRAAAGAAEG